MKKLSAILLAGLLFFNWYGYRLLVAYWQQRADRLLELQLDNDDYDESDLISIKIPATSLAYSNASPEFERIDGEIILEDAAYKYVKRRFFKDSVELLCIRNTPMINMTQARDDFFRQVNNLTHFPNSKAIAGSDIQKVYSPAALRFLFRTPEPIEARSAEFLIPSLQPGHDRSAERPPGGPALLL